MQQEMIIIITAMQKKPIEYIIAFKNRPQTEIKWQ